MEYIHPLTEKDGANYFGEDLFDYEDKKILVFLRENRNKKIEILVPGFVEKYDIENNLGRRVSIVEPIPSAKRKEIEYFLRGDGGNYGTDEDMFFVNVEVEPKGASYNERGISGNARMQHHK